MASQHPDAVQVDIVALSSRPIQKRDLKKIMNDELALLQDKLTKKRLEGTSINS